MVVLLYVRSLKTMNCHFSNKNDSTLLILQAPIMTAEDDSLEYFSLFFSEKKKRIDVSCESSD